MLWIWEFRVKLDGTMSQNLFEVGAEIRVYVKSLKKYVL